jgi:hypothetical protein
MASCIVLFLKLCGFSREKIGVLLVTTILTVSLPKKGVFFAYERASLPRREREMRSVVFPPYMFPSGTINDP